MYYGCVNDCREEFACLWASYISQNESDLKRLKQLDFDHQKLPWPCLQKYFYLHIVFQPHKPTVWANTYPPIQSLSCASEMSMQRLIKTNIVIVTSFVSWFHPCLKSSCVDFPTTRDNIQCTFKCPAGHCSVYGHLFDEPLTDRKSTRLNSSHL